MHNLNKKFISFSKKVYQCNKCKRLVNFRDNIVSKKRKSYIDQIYWGKPVSGFGDLNGKIVYTDELKNISSGENFIKWNGMTNDGLKLSSAVYIVSIANRTKVYNQKILFLKWAI